MLVAMVLLGSARRVAGSIVCGGTQSGISYSIKSLESDIGCRFFDRLGKKVVLTQCRKRLTLAEQSFIGLCKSACAAFR